MFKAGIEFKPNEVLSPMSNDVLTISLKETIESDGESVVKTYFEYTDFPDLDDNPMTTPERLVYPTSGLVTIEEEIENLEPGRTYYYRQVLIDGETILKSRPNSFIPSLEDIDPNPTISAGQRGVFVLGNSGAIVNLIDNFTTGEGTLEASNPESFYPSSIPLNVTNYGNLRWKILPGDALEEGHSESGGGFLYSLTFDMSAIPDNEFFRYRTILYRKDSTHAWVLVDSLPGVSVKRNYPYITVNGLTSFSDFMDATTSQDDPLPVELNTFSARARDLNVELFWSTATETNNYGFEVERKFISSLKDSTTKNIIKADWQSIAFIEGNGYSNSVNDYSYIDKRPLPGKYSYRLKQIDTDGKYGYSDEVEVEVGLVPNVFTLYQNYPNPFNPSTTIEFTIPADGRANLKVFNILGEEIATLVNEELKAGILHRAIFNATNFASGVYFYQLNFTEASTGNKKQLVKKMVVIK